MKKVIKGWVITANGMLLFENSFRSTKSQAIKDFVLDEPHSWEWYKEMGCKAVKATCTIEVQENVKGMGKNLMVIDETNILGS
jgi:hypothetical protein